MSIFIVAIIIVLLSTLACYAFISQSIEKKQIQKQRVIMALKTKQRNYAHLINGFPPHFLTSDLLSLIYRALIDTCDQLSKIEPKVTRHLDEVAIYTNQLDALPKTNQVQRARIDSPQSMKSIRQHLQELQQILIQQEAIKAISKAQLDVYTDQINRLALQMSVDVYIVQAKQAQQTGKLRLAMHFFTLAKKMMATENSTRTYDKQIAQLNAIIGKLEEKAQITGETKDSEQNNTLADTTTKEWENFAPSDEKWKKKQIYD